jgi:hypothetical protein
VRTHTHTLSFAIAMDVAIRSEKRRRSVSDPEGRLIKKKRKAEEEDLEGARREEERKEAAVAAAIERMEQDDFPTELILQIIGFSLRSSIAHCDISVHDKPATLRAGGLAWPEYLSLNAQRTIKKAVAHTFPKLVILELSAKFTLASSSDNQPRLVIPRALEGSESRVRNLVLNLDLNLMLSLAYGGRGKPLWTHLGTLTTYIETVAKSFPNLETCVLAVFIGSFNKYEHVSLPDSSLSSPTFPELGGIISARGSLMVELIDLVDAWAKRGPGKRRLLRFECQERFIRFHHGIGRGRENILPIWKVGVGPLVRVDASSERVVNDDASDREAVDAMHMQDPTIGNEASSRSEAERLFHQAYRFERQIRIRGGLRLPDRRQPIEN